MSGLYGETQKKPKKPKSAEDKIKDQGGLCKTTGRIQVCPPGQSPDSFVKEDEFIAPVQEKAKPKRPKHRKVN